MRILFALPIALLAASAAGAGSMDSMALAQDLGTILGSEQVCGLSYDQAAISSWIDKNTDPADMGFPSMLNMMTQGSEMQAKEMSASAKTAHCRAVERSARHYGFIKAE